MEHFWKIVKVPAFDKLPPKERSKAYKYVALKVLKHWQFWATFLNFNACLVGGLYLGSLFGSGEPGDIVRLISELVGVAIGGGLSGLLLGLAAARCAKPHIQEYLEQQEQQ